MSTKLFLVRMAAVFAVLLILVNFMPHKASAAQLTNRSVTILSGVPSAITSHTFQLTPVTAGNIGSLVFEYCDNSPIIEYSCSAPSGLDVSAASLVSQGGNIGFSIDGPNSTTNKLTLTRPSAPAVTISSSYGFDNITNPDQSNHTTYVRISTYTTIDGSGSYTDNGSVAFSTVGSLAISTFVPPFLQLCVAVTVSTNCSSSSGNSVNLGILSSKQAKSGTSQFSVGTNSDTGYIVYILGTTMTSGNDVIPSINPPASSQTGKSQFGMNLVGNSNPSVGQNPQGPGTGAPLAGYNQANIFNFSNGDGIAASNIPSDYSQMTVSYIANVNSSQAPGVYNTTLTYMATAQF